MAIFRKTHLHGYLTELALFHQELVATLGGTPPLASMAAQFHQSPDDFQRDFTDIDLDRLNRAIGHFKVVVDDLKSVKAKAQKPVHSK